MDQMIFESSCAKVYFVPDIKLGKIIWNGTVTPADYQRPFLALLDLKKKGTEVHRFMSDIRNQGVVSPESRRWFEKEMVPAAVDNGLRRAAVVSGSNAFKTYYINLILGTVNKFGLPFKIFNNEEKAMAFLMEE